MPGLRGHDEGPSKLKAILKNRKIASRLHIDGDHSRWRIAACVGAAIAEPIGTAKAWIGHVDKTAISNQRDFSIAWLFDPSEVNAKSGAITISTASG